MKRNKDGVLEFDSITEEKAYYDKKEAFLQHPDSTDYLRKRYSYYLTTYELGSNAAAQKVCKDCGEKDQLIARQQDLLVKIKSKK